MWFSDESSFGNDMGWWKEEHFNASDADGDGLLNITEFNEWASTLITKFNFGKRETCYFVLIGVCLSNSSILSFSFQHPADSKNPKLLQWLCKEEVRWLRLLHQFASLRNLHLASSSNLFILWFGIWIWLLCERLRWQILPDAFFLIAVS